MIAEAFALAPEPPRNCHWGITRLEIRDVSGALSTVEVNRIGFTPTLLVSRDGETPERITRDLADAENVDQRLREAGIPRRRPKG